MKIISNLKKYDFITLELERGTIKNCLVYQVGTKGIHIYPIGIFIEDVDYPRAVAKIFIPNDKIINITKDNINLLFYAVNSQHKFLREALEYHMKNEADSRKN